MQSDPLEFEENELQSGKQQIKLKPTDIISELFTQDGEFCIKVYHFYQEIWSFLINYNYVSLNIFVIDITQYNYVIQFQVYLLEKAFQEQEKIINEINQDNQNQNQKDQRRERGRQKLVHQYAKESFIVLFEILNLPFTIRASLKPKQEIQSLNQFLINKFRKLKYYQIKYLAQNLLIPSNLNIKQVHVTRDNIIQIEQQVKTEEIENQSKDKIEQEENNQNLFSVNEQQSYQFTTCQQPKDLKNNLFDYQAQAVNWMLYREQRIAAEALNLQNQKQTLNKMWSQIKLNDNEYIYFNELTGQFSENSVPSKDVKGGILADAMGLGKSICSLALILLSREMKQQQINDDIEEPYKKKVKLNKKYGNTLLVVQKTVFGHWTEEIEKHCEQNKLEYYEYHTKQSRSKDIKLEIYDIVITTYGVLKQDFNKNGILYSYEWERIILDEAHIIKSKSTTCAKAASSVEAQCRWCLTGTPIQNHLEDLFSLFHFLQVETFSDYHWFNHYINMQQDKAMKFNLLHEILKPVLLRRTKQSESIQLQLHLPPKQHFIVRIKLSKEEQNFYNTLYLNTCKQIKEYFGIGTRQRSIKNNYMHIFQLLSLLRLCCDHTGLVLCKLRHKTIKQNTATQQKSEWMIKQFIEDVQHNLEQSLQATILQLEERQERVRQQNQEEEIDEDDGISIENELSYQSTADETLNQQNQQEQPMNEEQIDRELRQNIQKLEKLNEDKQDTSQTQKKYEQIFEKVKNEDCAICQEAFNIKNQIYYLGCTHLYCSSCFENLQKQNQRVNCPLCRTQISKNDKIKIVYQFPALQQNNQQYEQQNQNPEEYAEIVNPQPWYKESTKLNEVLKYIEYVKNRNEKVVIFTQWLSIMNFIEGRLRIKKIQFRKILGKVDLNLRKQNIQDFYEKNITVMLISLKAGSYGINLCCANHVILVDPWWNPAVEDQAVERVHRLGQQKNVQIVSFICENTIEEKVLQLHKIKRQLFKDALHLNLPEHEFNFQDQIEFVMEQKLDF